MAADQRYPPRLRLKRAGEFRQVLDRGEVFPGRECLVRRLARPDGRARLGLSVPRGYGDAVARNRFRRLVREAFRRCSAAWPAYDLLVSPRRGLVTPTLGGVERDLVRAVEAAHGAPPRARRSGPP
jgi:ribonuclease P protein component